MDNNIDYNNKLEKAALIVCTSNDIEKEKKIARENCDTELLISFTLKSIKFPITRTFIFIIS